MIYKNIMLNINKIIYLIYHIVMYKRLKDVNMAKDKETLSSIYRSSRTIFRLLVCSSISFFLLTACCPCSQEETTEEAPPPKLITQTTTEIPTTPGKAQYVGASSCKTCHANQYKQWEATKHANAFSKLKGPEQNDPKCLKCHTTGYKESGGFTILAETPKMVNIQCEDCHGPGSTYKSRSIMKDKNKAIQVGLVMPTEAVCKKCHNPESPNFKPFDFKARYEQIKHKL